MSDKLHEKVTSLLDETDEFLNKHQLIFVLLKLRANCVVEYLNKFIKDDLKGSKESILDNVSRIIVCAKTVYESDKYCDPYPDEFYDKVLSKFKKYRPEPFGDNGLGLANATYKYETLSGTLDKVHFIRNDDRGEYETRDSFEDYVDKIPEKDGLTILLNQKKDGTSVTVDYELRGKDYVPRSAISRGKRDYGCGTDVSAILMLDGSCKACAELISTSFGFTPKFIGVQYELLVSNKQKKHFEEYIKQKFANNRSAAAALLRRIVYAAPEEAKRLKTFMSLVPVGFDVLDEYVTSPSYYSKSWDELYIPVLKTFRIGDIAMDYRVLRNCKKKDIVAWFEQEASAALSLRDSLNHAIDGLVLTICNPSVQRKMGRKNNINQYQIAYKFPEESYKTTIRDIEITTGNFGYKEMLLVVDPVVLNGTVQQKAQVHSLARLNALGLHYGDEIVLKLSGDCIPYGYVDQTCKKGHGDLIKFPEFCECGTRLVEENNKMRCPNVKCPFRITGSLVTFFRELNAKGIGDKLCAQLNSELGITKPSEILRLTYSDFRKLKGFKDSKANAAVHTIDELKNNPRTPETIISAIGIDGLRSSTAAKILKIMRLEDLIEIAESKDEDKLTNKIHQADGIDENARKIASGIISNVDELKAILRQMNVRASDAGSFNKSILISGMRHDNALTQVANRAGFEVKESGSKYDILVIRDQSMLNASKAQYALSHNRPIMTRDEFMKAYDLKN